MNFTEEERYAYEDRFKWFLIEQNTIEKYKREGIEEGIEKGKAEEKKEIALNLLRSGVAIDIISSTTNLSIAEITSLSKK
jgi:predicted transposase/invertase (TIGR01784 family)